MSVLGNQASVAHRTGRAATAAALVQRRYREPPYFFKYDYLDENFKDKDQPWVLGPARGAAVPEMEETHKKGGRTQSSKQWRRL